MKITVRKQRAAIVGVFALLVAGAAISFLPQLQQAPETPTPDQDNEEEPATPSASELAESEIRQFMRTTVPAPMQTKLTRIIPVQGLQANGSRTGPDSLYGYTWETSDTSFYIGTRVGDVPNDTVRIIDTRFQVKGQAEGEDAQARLTHFLNATLGLQAPNQTCTGATFRTDSKHEATYCTAFWTPDQNTKAGINAIIGKDGRIQIEGCRRTPEMLTYHYTTCDVDTTDIQSTAEQGITSFIRSTLRLEARPPLDAVQAVRNVTVEPDHQALNGTWTAHGFEWTAADTAFRVEIRTGAVKGDSIMLDRRFKVEGTADNASNTETMLEEFFETRFRYDIGNTTCRSGTNRTWTTSPVTECTAFWRPSNTTAVGFTAAIVPDTGFIVLKGCEREPAMATFDYKTCGLSQERTEPRNDELPPQYT